jgi:hypothetical protein
MKEALQEEAKFGHALKNLAPAVPGEEDSIEWRRTCCCWPGSRKQEGRSRSQLGELKRPARGGLPFPAPCLFVLPQHPAH